MCNVAEFVTSASKFFITINLYVCHMMFFSSVIRQCKNLSAFCRDLVGSGLNPIHVQIFYVLHGMGEIVWLLFCWRVRTSGTCLSDRTWSLGALLVYSLTDDRCQGVTADWLQSNSCELSSPPTPVLEHLTFSVERRRVYGASDKTRSHDKQYTKLTGVL